MLTSIFDTKRSIRGNKQRPITNITIAIVRYAFLNNVIRAVSFTVSCSARGLYKLYTIALPTPSSTSDSIEITSVNKPFKLTAVSPMNLIITNRITNVRSK